MRQGTVTIGDKRWSVSIADWPWELTQGLGNLTSIRPMTGMLFNLGISQTVTVTTEPMLFSLDIAFIKPNYTILEIKRDVAPGNIIKSSDFALFTLEVNAGELADISAGNSAILAQEPDIISQIVTPVGVLMVMGIAGRGLMGAVRQLEIRTR